MCYELLQRDRQRYGDNWPQLWAHENAHTKLLIELPRFLSTRVKLADRSLHTNPALYFANFYEYGGSCRRRYATLKLNQLLCEIKLQTCIVTDINAWNDICIVQSGSLIVNHQGTKKSVHNRDTSY